MVRFDSDHANWVLVVILVAMALLLAMVSSASGDQITTQQGVSQSAIRANQVAGLAVAVQQDRKEARTPSEVWYVARELYLAGRFAEARRSFEQAATYSFDPALQMWAGMAAYRMNDHSAAIRHWRAAWCDDFPRSEAGVWPVVALTAAYLESGQLKEAAKYIVPLERGDFGSEAAQQPVVSFYAALVYEQLAITAPQYRDAVEESLAETYSPPLASSDAGFMISPNNRSWLIFLTKRSLQRTIRGARFFEWTAPLVPESATVEPSLAPTVEDLLEALGSADFVSQARGKLRALRLYESPPKRRIEIFDDPELIKRGRFIA
jgi:tetratricopeptide (TPR) repeat protein